MKSMKSNPDNHEATRQGRKEYECVKGSIVSMFLVYNGNQTAISPRYYRKTKLDPLLAYTNGNNLENKATKN